MASSSTSSIQKCFKYDVFLSFRGEDTRKTFVGHLFYALQQKSIHTYKDDERIKKGNTISDELIKSIQDSRFHIIVFSKNYASSSWCLEELVKIMECQKMPEQTAYPVFYDVEPTEVRHQTGEFGKVFAKNKKEEVVAKWREALKEAAGLAGWELKNSDDGDEAKFIQRIVEEILLELRCINFSDDEKLVGMKTRIKDVVSSLEMGVDDVRMIGIKGMGGAGKTTLAKTIFDHISFKFEGSSFVEKVKETSTTSLCNLKKLQKQVLRDVLKDRTIKISNVHEGKKMMKKIMCCRRVLVVLDDVDHIHQLEALAGGPSWFKSGSRIIVTTRDEQLLVAHRVNLIHDVILLSNAEALCLFSRYAFGKEIPIQGYEKLSSEVVHYAAGLPLTITILGSFLCGKIKDEWRSAIQRLKTIPLKDTLDVLEISYNGLEEEHKEIFLDVACMLKGYEKENAIRALESCGFYARIGLRVLQQKSLITISGGYYETLDMHDRIEEMGQDIVRRKLEEPNKHSRLWIAEEIKDILVSDQVLNKLRFLDISCSNLKNVDLSLAPNLEILNIRSCSDLVQLHMPVECSKIKSIYIDCPKLRTLDLRGTQNLEELSVENCLDLVELHIPVECLKLRYIYVKNLKLRTLDLRGTLNLERLSVLDCVDLVELHIPDECPKLQSINIEGLKLRTTLDLRGTPNLESLSLVKCVDLVELHMAVEYPKLISLDLSHAKLTIPDLRRTPNLETLTLVECVGLVELCIPVDCLKLKSINVNGSRLRTLDIRGALNLETLRVEECVDLVELHMAVEYPKLKSLDLSHTKLTIPDLRRTPNLETLTLVKCVGLVELHIPVDCLKLKFIDVKSSTLDLRGAWNLETLHVEECVDLVELHIPVEALKLKSIDINHSKLRTLDLQGTPNLETLSVKKCVDLVELHIPVECPKLKSIDIKGVKLKTFDLGLTPNLETLNLTECYSLVELHAPFECLKNLSDLNLSGCSRFKSFSFRKRLCILAFDHHLLYRRWVGVWKPQMMIRFVAYIRE